jgi:NitT/TauT family transport system substrate-binding protein
LDGSPHLSRLRGALRGRLLQQLFIRRIILSVSTRRDVLTGFGSLGVAIALANGPRTVAAAELTKLTVATNGSDSASSAFVAKELGYFAQNGLDVEITTTANGGAAINAVASESIDIAASNLSSLILATSRGIPVIAVAPGGVYSGTPTLALLVLKDSPLRTAADLNGKVVVVPGLNTIGQFAVQAYMDKNGGDWRSVKFIELPLPEMSVALVQHRADAITIFEPFVTAALDSGQMRIMADPNSAIGSKWFTAIWIASDAFVQKKPDVARRFAQSISKAAVWANSHRNESAAILVKYTKLSPDVASRMGRDPQGTTLDLQLIQPIVDVMKKYGNVPAQLTAAQLVWSPPR